MAHPRFRRLHVVLVFLCLASIVLAGVSPARATPPAGFKRPRPGLEQPAPWSPARIPTAAQSPQPAPQAPQASPAYWASTVYQSFESGDWEIYMTNNFGDNKVRLTWDPRADVSPRLDRSASQVVFVSTRNGNSEIYKMNPDGSGQTRLTNDDPLTNINPTWSADGRSITFSSKESAQYDLFTIQADGSGLTQIVPSNGLDNLFPAWSPDGSRLAWVQADSQGVGRLWVMNADGSQAHALSPSLYYLESPAWSPDGSQIAFDADLDGDGWTELGKVQANGLNPALVYDPGQNMVDAWLGCWFENGLGLMYTRVEYVAYDNKLYLNATHIQSVSLGGLFNFSVQDPYAAAPDYVSSDHTAPLLTLHPLPAFARASGFSIRWDQQDSGGSGIAQHHIQTRPNATSPWTDYLKTGVQYPEVGVSGIPGNDLYVRIRARDWAGNWGTWTAGSDHARLYAWELSGQVKDNRGNSLAGAGLAFTPAALNSVSSGAEANFLAYLGSGGGYTVAATYPGYVPLAQSPLQVSADRSLTAWMRPVDDAIQNGGFEADPGALVGWTSSPTVTLKTETRDTGQASTLLGVECTVLPCLDGGQLVPALGFMTVEDLGLAVDRQGGVHVLYYQRGGAPGIVYQKRSAGGSWSSPELIPGSAEIMDYDLVSENRLAVDAQGNVYAVWSYSISGSSGVFFSQRSKATGAWSAPVKLAVGSLATIAVDSHGGVHLSYRGANYGEGVYLERLPSGVWQAPVSLVSRYAFSVTLAVGPDDAVHYLWYDQNIDHVMYRMRPASGAWQQPEDLSPYVLWTSFPVVVVDPQNTVHVVSGADYTQRPAGKGWSAKEVAGACGTQGTRVALTADSQGTVIEACTDQDYHRFYRVRRNGAWSGPVKISDDLYLKYALAAGPDGRIHYVEGAVWQDPIQGFRYFTDQLAPQAVTYTLSQKVSLAGSMHRPTLAFWYAQSYASPRPVAGLEVSLSTGEAVTQVFSSTATTDWKPVWVDLTPWAGQAITVTFSLPQGQGEPFRFAKLDDISLGSWSTPQVIKVAPGAIGSGWAGQVVTLTGSNLLPGVTVRIDDTPAAHVEWVDEATLRVTLPPGLAAGRHALWVINPGGQTAALPNGLTLGRFMYLPLLPRSGLP